MLTRLLKTVCLISFLCLTGTSHAAIEVGALKTDNSLKAAARSKSSKKPAFKPIPLEDLAPDAPLEPEIIIPERPALPDGAILLPDTAKPTALPEQTEIPALDINTAAPDIWARMRLGFGMRDLVDNQDVERHIRAFQARPQAVTNILTRGSKYLYHIVTELEKRGMPTELALLPLVESAYNPRAYSSAKAAGLWQFIPSTGRNFSLQQDWWVDERRDVLASTAAALTYLQAIYELHGDWQLALASYNWGENAVLRAVNSNRNAGKPTDFNSLRMPAETRQYVPKLQAIKTIVANPEEYGIQLPPVPNAPYFVTVERNQGMDVALAAKFAEMPLDEFLSLNPAYNRPVIPGSHDADLVLPISHAEKFSKNLAAHGGPLLSWKTYSLPRRERVEQLAKRLKLNVSTLREANGLPPRARLAAGYTLLVPRATDVNLAADSKQRSIMSKRTPSRALSKAASRTPARKPAQASKTKNSTRTKSTRK